MPLARISRTRHARSPQRVTSSELPAPQLLRVLQLYHKVASAHLPAPHILHASGPHFAHSTRTISAEGCAGSRQIPLSPAFRALDTHDLRRGLRGQPANRALSPAFRALDTHALRRGSRADRTNRILACISRARHARSPQRVARGPDKSHSRLHFAHSTRTISAEGCARSRQIALSPAFRALDTHDLRRGLRADRTNRTLACISRTRHARPDKSHSRLHFAHSTRTISAEGCGHPAHRTLTCISRTRHARSPQRVARAPGTSHSHLHFAHSTRTISAEGCAGTRHIALSPAFRALDTHDLRRGLHFRLTLFVPPSAFKREFIKWGNVFSLGHLPC